MKKENHYMRKYHCYIMPYGRFKLITKELPEFDDNKGHLKNSCDWWNSLQRAIGEPLVSVRPSGRISNREILVLCANGSIGKKRISVFGDLDYCKDFLKDVFKETGRNEREMFLFYKFPDLSKKEKKQLTEWMVDGEFRRPEIPIRRRRVRHGI